MKPQSCKSKGRRLQQQVAKRIRETFPHLCEDDCHSTPMGAHGEDVRLSTAARNCVPLSIECKCVEKINVWACIEQCEQNANGHIPCLIFTKNRAKTYAVLPWEELLSILKRLQGGTLPPRLTALLLQLQEFIPLPESPPESPSLSPTFFPNADEVN